MTLTKNIDWRDTNGAVSVKVFLTVTIILCMMLLIGCVGTHQETAAYNTSCITNTLTFEVRGTSLSDIIDSGTDVRVLEGYHHCNNLNRNDIVLYRFAGNDAPLIKSVKAVPGDDWYLDGCNIFVNNKTLTTKNKDGTIGVPYCIGDTRRLQLYVEDYPTIPANTYLLMGNQPGGSMDGSLFGLVSGEDIIGKAEKR